MTNKLNSSSKYIFRIKFEVKVASSRKISSNIYDSYSSSDGTGSRSTCPLFYKHPHLGNHGTGTIIDQSILKYFKKFTAQYTISCFIYVLGYVSLECIYICALKCVPVLCPVFFVSVQNLHCTFLRRKRDHKYQGNIYVGP